MRSDFPMTRLDGDVMMFEVGKRYEAYDFNVTPILIKRRTDKTVWITNDRTSWQMRIKIDDEGNEICTDSAVPLKWREAYTYSSKFERN